MRFQLISASGVKFDDEAYEVIAPTTDGTIAILADHMPLMSAGKPGVLSIRRKASDHNDAMESFAIYGGVLQTDGKLTRFVTDNVTTPDEVSEKEAADALERARELVASAGSRTELHEARRVLQHHQARLHLAQLKRRHHN